MRTKVIKYDSSGNRIVNAYLELEYVADNVYKAFHRADRMDNPEYDTFLIVFRFKDVYFSAGTAYRMDVENPGRCRQLVDIRKGWLQAVEEKARQWKYINILEIRVFEALGMNTAPLLQSREAAERRMKEERQQREEKEKEIRLRQQQNYDRMLDGRKAEFLAGKMIPADAFLELAKRDGFEIHIRTKGTFRKARKLDRRGTITFSRIKGRRDPDFTGCHKAVSGYLNFILPSVIRQRLMNCGVPECVWDRLDTSVKDNIYITALLSRPFRSESDGTANKLVCILADMVIAERHGIPIENMRDDKGKLHDAHKEEFNSLYNEIAGAITLN